ncbi:hypothetical protein BV898_14695 [Hypsibius exemplaris]|uniref:Uncharacterized protein n=1 Tax=Hypsibius exemplaris TaxID=2072580 RepID=A0A9X6N9U4_HYPEX|nr:hypothetical protein BV898_14695 [Hypsibius exemplaris]
MEKELSGPNPLTRSALSLKHRVSATTIANVIGQDLEGEVRKKCRVHALSNKQAKQRLDRGPSDEVWVYFPDVNGTRKIYYEFRGERSPESWTKFWKESHPKGVMSVTGVCSRGKTAIRFVKPGANIKSEYYIQHVLKPLFKNDIRKLFPESFSIRPFSTMTVLRRTLPESPKNDFEIPESSLFRKSNGWAVALI